MGETTPVTARDRLAVIYRSPGPYCSVYLATEHATADPHTSGGLWSELRGHLETQGATDEALAAIEARLGLPAPEDTAGMAILAAADGTTVVDYGMEPPRIDFAVVETLPYVAPMLEWQQREIPHVVVTVDDDGADVASFGVDQYRHLLADHPSAAESLQALVASILEQAAPIAAELIVVVGDARHAAPLADALAVEVPVGCRVVTDKNSGDVDEVVDSVMRHVSDAAARSTVAYLRERRFLETHDAAVDGASATVAALHSGEADVLLIHDDPNDDRKAWIGSMPNEISLEPNEHDVPARFVDAAIRSAVLQGVGVHIIPSTGSGGPDDGAAAMTHH